MITKVFHHFDDVGKFYRAQNIKAVFIKLCMEIVVKIQVSALVMNVML